MTAILLAALSAFLFGAMTVKPTNEVAICRNVNARGS